MLTTVVSVRGRKHAELLADPSFVYVGRQFAGWPASIWGNPFKHGMNGFQVLKIFDRLPDTELTHDMVVQVDHFEPITVEQAVAYYQQWVEAQLELINRLVNIRGKKLGCWCTTWDGRGEPSKACHAVALAQMVNLAPF